jgi:hypothetical protein
VPPVSIELERSRAVIRLKLEAELTLGDCVVVEIFGLLLDARVVEEAVVDEVGGVVDEVGVVVIGMVVVGVVVVEVEVEVVGVVVVEVEVEVVGVVVVEVEVEVVGVVVEVVVVVEKVAEDIVTCILLFCNVTLEASIK